MYNIIALIGEAGTGKDTIMKKLLEKYPGYFHEIISHTTRPIREGEVDGVNYHYITDAEFLDLMANNQMLESSEFNHWFYGTSLTACSEGKINIGVFNPEGIRSLQARDDVWVKVYRITTFPKERLLRQLNREENPNVNEIIRRYRTDLTDFTEDKLTFSYTIVENNDKEDLGLATYGIAYDLGLVSP